MAQFTKKLNLHDDPVYSQSLLPDRPTGTHFPKHSNSGTLLLEQQRHQSRPCVDISPTSDLKLPCLFPSPCAVCSWRRELTRCFWQQHKTVLHKAPALFYSGTLVQMSLFMPKGLLLPLTCEICEKRERDIIVMEYKGISKPYDSVWQADEEGCERPLFW